MPKDVGLLEIHDAISTDWNAGSWLLMLGLLTHRERQRGTGPRQTPQPPKTVRLYVFDCGVINVNRAGTERYKVTPEEVGETRFSVPCFLVAHPKGTLMWDLGILPDETVEARARGEQGNPTATAASVTTVPRTLASQLADLGYRPADITYFAFSHAHVDHNANANLFAASTWLARPAERAFMWEEGNTRVNRTFFDNIKNSKSISLDKDEYDVFGDGTVILKAAPGHSPGHQVLVLDLGDDGAHHDRRRPVSLPAGAHAAPATAGHRVQRPAVGGVARDDRGVSAADEDARSGSSTTSWRMRS